MPSKRSSATPSSLSSSPSKYTQPALRERLKRKLMAGDKGGRKGEWSARKSQLLAAEYKKHGGGYRGEKAAAQRHLETWTKEKWRTKDGESRARHGKTTERYLPKEVWEKLTPAERKATDQKKRSASRRGKQVVANNAAAKRARRRASIRE